MPHLHLETSANIYESDERLRLLLKECQEVLVSDLPTQLASCKSRVSMHDVYVLGDGNIKNAFFHLMVKVLKGRSQELLHTTADKLKNIIATHAYRSIENLNVSISVEIVELSDIYSSLK